MEWEHIRECVCNAMDEAGVSLGEREEALGMLERAEAEDERVNQYLAPLLRKQDELERLEQLDEKERAVLKFIRSEVADAVAVLKKISARHGGPP